jgi:hypothetical protein
VQGIELAHQPGEGLAVFIEEDEVDAQDHAHVVQRVPRRPLPEIDFIGSSSHQYEQLHSERGSEYIC